MRKCLVHDGYIWRFIIICRSKFPPVDQRHSHQLEIVRRHRAHRESYFVALFCRWRLALNVHRRGPIISGQRNTPGKCSVLDTRNRRDALQGLPMKRKPGRLALHVRDTHGQNSACVISRRHLRNFDHGANQQTRAYKQRQRQRGLQHRDTAQQPPLSDSRRSFRPCIFQHLHRIQAKGAQRRNGSRKKRCEHRQAQVPTPKLPSLP